MLWPVGLNRSVSVGFQEFVGLCGLPHFPMTSRESITSAISDTRTSFRAEPVFGVESRKEKLTDNNAAKTQET